MRLMQTSVWSRVGEAVLNWFGNAWQVRVAHSDGAVTAEGARWGVNMRSHPAVAPPSYALTGGGGSCLQRLFIVTRTYGSGISLCWRVTRLIAIFSQGGDSRLSSRMGMAYLRSIFTLTLGGGTCECGCVRSQPKSVCDRTRNKKLEIV